MFRKALLAIVLVALAGAAFTAEPTSPFLPFYFLYGEVTATTVPPSGIDGHKVIIYQSTPFSYGAITSIEGSKYVLNIMEAQYYGNFTIDIGSPYYAAIPRISDNFGANAVSFTVPDMGYYNLPLNIVDGEGPYISLKEGPVILNIIRQADTPNSAIKITWKINTEAFPAYIADTPVDIYYKTGSGSGEYTSATGYNKVINSSTTFLPDGLSGSVSTSLKEVTINTQVGVGYPELYFKGLIAGSLPAATGDLGLAGAVAVGKVNVPIVVNSAKDSLNLISTPFITLGAGGDEPNDVFGLGQLLSGTIKGDVIQDYDNTVPKYRTAELLSSNWVKSEAFKIVCGKGYWLLARARASQAPLTLVGKVSNVPSTANFSLGLNLLGNPYPILNPVATVFLSPWTNNILGDVVQYFSLANPSSPKYETAEYLDATWKFSAPFNVLAGKGYWYLRRTQSASPYNWNYSPYP